MLIPHNTTGKVFCSCRTVGDVGNLNVEWLFNGKIIIQTSQSRWSRVNGNTQSNDPSINTFSLIANPIYITDAGKITVKNSGDLYVEYTFAYQEKIRGMSSSLYIHL